MFYTKTPQGYLIRLTKGEDVTENILKFCTDQHIQSGWFWAIGSLSEGELGYYHLDKKEYSFKPFQGDHELISLTGNISIVDEKPFVHMHGVLSNEDFSCIGGHIKSGVAGATCEIYLTNFEKEIHREMDIEVGLKLLHCEIKATE